MPEAIESLTGVAALVYASTNIDDLLVLAVFFADPHVRVGAVVAGRFIGLGALMLVSGAAALLALAVPAEWIALLGFVPLALGMHLLLALFRKGGEHESAKDAIVGELKEAFPLRVSPWRTAATISASIYHCSHRRRPRSRPTSPCSPS